MADERGRVLMAGTCSSTTPPSSKLKELIDAGELGDVLYLYGNRQNLGKVRSRRERALVARRRTTSR